MKTHRFILEVVNPTRKQVEALDIIFKVVQEKLDKEGVKRRRK